MGDFNAQDLASTAWAFAAAVQSDAPHFAALAREAEQRWEVVDAPATQLY